MATREEILRFQIETAGEKDLLALSDSLDKVAVDAGKGETAAGQLVAELNKLEKASAAAAQFQRLSAAVDTTSADLLEARAALDALNAEFDRTDKSSKEVTAAFKAAEKEVKRLEGAQTKQTAALERQGEVLRKAGVDTDKLADEQQRLAVETAKSEKTIQQQAVTLRANAAAAQASEKRWKALGASLQDARTKANDLAAGLAKAGVAAAAAAAAATAYAGVRFFQGGIADAGAFESALGRIQAAAGLAADQMVGVQTAIEESARAASKDVPEAAAAFEQLAREGLSAADAQVALKASLDFATVAAISGADAVKTLGDATGAFNIGAERMADVADLLTASALKSGLTVGEFAEQVKSAGPAAADAGLSIEETAAAMVLLAKNGIEGGRAVGAFNQVIGAFQDPASKFSQELVKLGITSRDFGTVLDQLGTKGSAAEGAFLALGDRGTLVLRALAQNGGRSLREVQAELANTAGASASAAAIINKDFDTALANLGNTIDNTRRKLLTPLLGPLADELVKVEEAVFAFTQSPAFEELQTAIVEALGAAAEAASDFAGTVNWSELAGDISEFATNGTASFKDFADKASGFVDGVVTTFRTFGVALDALQTGIFGLAAAGTKIAQLGQQFVEFQLRITNSLPAVRLVAKALGTDLGDAADRAGERAKALGAVVDEFAGRTVDNANEAAAGIEKIGGALDTVGASAQPAANQTAEAITGIGEAAQYAKGEVVELAATGDQIQRDLTDAARGFSVASKGSADEVAEAAKASAEFMANLKVVGEDAGEGIARSASKAASAVRSIGEEADSAAGATGGLSDGLDRTAASAEAASFAIQGASQEFAQLLLLQSQQKLGASVRPEDVGKLQDEFNKQSEQFERQLENTRRLNGQYDETTRIVDRLRVQFRFLSEDRLRQLAAEQVELERNIERQERSAGIERDRVQTPSNPPPSTPPGTPTQPGRGGINVTINVTGSIIGSSPQRLAEELARLLLPELRRLEARGA